MAFDSRSNNIFESLLDILNILGEQSATETEIKTTKKLNKQLEIEHNELQEIGIGAPCPKCKQKLTQHYEEVQQEHLKKLKEFKIKILELEDEKEKLGKQIHDLEKKRKSLRDLENELGEIQHDDDRKINAASSLT